MKLQAFNGGINTRLAPQLLSSSEAVESTNVDFTTGELTPIKSKVSTAINVALYSYYYLAKNEWVSSSEYRNYLEYQEVLYYTQVDTYPRKYNGSVEHRLGIIAPDTAINVNDVLTQPPPITAITFNQTAVGNIPAQEENGNQITLDYLLVNRDSYGLISTTFIESIALTGSGSDTSMEVSVTGRVANTDVYRKYNGIYRFVNTITGATTTITDAAYDISFAAEYEAIGLTGTYQYLVTYYNSSDGSESQPSPLSSEVVLAGGVCKLDEIPTSSDPQVDRRRLYRVGGSLTVFTLVTELDNIVTSFDDDIRDVDVDGRVLDAAYNNEAPTGLKYLTEFSGYFFGVVEDHVYFSRLGLPDAWPSTNYFDYSAPITGLGVTTNGVLVFTKYSTYIIVKTSDDLLASYPVDPSQGCISHESIVPIQGSIIWASSDGVCSSSGGPAEVVSRNKLGKLTLSVVNAVVYDDVYYLHQTNGNTLALDFRFTSAFNNFNFGISKLVTANDVLYGYVAGELYELQSASTVESFTYTSPLFTEGEYCNRKTYKHFYVRSEGELTVDIYIDKILVSSQELTTTDTHDLTIPQDDQNGYSLQFVISGTGTVNEIEYVVMGRQNGR